MRLTLRALAALLAYPTAELKAHIGDLREGLITERLLPAATQRRLAPLLRRFESDDLLDLQTAYSDLFDRSRALSLHLFEHVHGDSRERGQALIDLGQQYVDRGFYLARAELPDFVPVFLEFVSCLPVSEARDMLGQPAHVFAALAERLDRRGVPYAAVFHALIALAAGRLEAEALAELQAREPVDDPAKIDEEWEERPVTFTQPVHDMGGPTGIVAKIRAAGRTAVGRR